MKRNFLFGPVVVVIYVMVSFGCSKEDEVVIDNTSIPAQPSFIDLENGTLEISDFIWKGLNEYYYWQGKVELLSDEVAESEDLYSKFISSNSNPEDFFSSLKHPEDLFSLIYDDYSELENSLEGISTTTGVEFGLLFACQNCNELIGYVKYILEGSKATGKDIKRGDLFIGVNGTILTASNYQALLFGNQPSITLNMASIENGSIVRNFKEVELVKEENFKINPIQIAKVLDGSLEEIPFEKKNRLFNV